MNIFYGRSGYLTFCLIIASLMMAILYFSI